MKSMSAASTSDQRVAQLIDANLDRAREGLRVVEDWCRFGINRVELVKTLKDWRQQLGQHHLQIYKQSRSTSTDNGIGLRHQAQENRQKPQEIIAANCARAQEALRVLEEFSRTLDPSLAETSANIRYGLYELEIKVLEATNGEQRKQKLQKCNLCLITSPKVNLPKTVASALKAGVRMVQYRCKEKSDVQKLEQAKELSSICHKFKALFIVNDRIDIALAVDADGVHLGQDDVPTNVARRLIGGERLIGRSIHSIQDLQQAEDEGCDYLGVGPISITKTKPELQPIGINFISEISKQASLPWFAIGGINNSNLESLRIRGGKRIAVVSAIMNAIDPEIASKELLEGLK